MLDVPRALTSNRLMNALTGLNREEFARLSQSFETVLADEQAKQQSQVKRNRRPGGGRKHTLSGGVEKLFFILFYIKCYPTFDVAGFFFNVDRAQTCRWVHQLLPLLERTLGREVVLPQRKIGSVEEFIQLFPEVKRAFMDGTERPTQRPGQPEAQKEHYSGKKKRHTKKNLVVSDREKRVLILTETEPGKHHDYQLFKTSGIGNHVPPQVRVGVDLGFQGIQTDYPDLTVHIPHKKPRGKELTEEQKAENSRLAGSRVVVEHALAGIKRLNAVTDIYRNRKLGMEDRLMLVACGLWNYHVEMA